MPFISQSGWPCKAVCNQIRQWLGNWAFHIHPSFHPTVNNICVMWSTTCMPRKRQIKVPMGVCACTQRTKVKQISINRSSVDAFTVHDLIKHRHLLMHMQTHTQTQTQLHEYASVFPAFAVVIQVAGKLPSLLWLGSRGATWKMG